MLLSISHIFFGNNVETSALLHNKEKVLHTSPKYNKGTLGYVVPWNKSLNNCGHKCSVLYNTGDYCFNKKLKENCFKPPYSSKQEKVRVEYLDQPKLENAKVQWFRNIHNQEVRDVMNEYDKFYAKYLLHPLKDIKRRFSFVGKQRIKSLDIVRLNGERSSILLGEVVGSGGSKKFFDIGNGETFVSISSSHQHYDELMMMRYLQHLGLFVNRLEPIVYFWNHKTDTQIKEFGRASLIAKSFDSYKENDEYPTDGDKEWGDESAFPKNIKDCVECKKDWKDWLPLIDPMINDLRILARIGVKALRDAIHIIYVGQKSKHHSGNKKALYEARAFPYDFSSKWNELKGLPDNVRLSEKTKQHMFKCYIELAICYIVSPHIDYLKEEWIGVRDLLVVHYMNDEILYSS